jgi:hypothetical protein
MAILIIAVILIPFFWVEKKLPRLKKDDAGIDGRPDDT